MADDDFEVDFEFNWPKMYTFIYMYTGNTVMVQSCVKCNLCNLVADQSPWNPWVLDLLLCPHLVNLANTNSKISSLRGKTVTIYYPIFKPDREMDRAWLWQPHQQVTVYSYMSTTTCPLVWVNFKPLQWVDKSGVYTTSKWMFPFEGVTYDNNVFRVSIYITPTCTY